MTKRMRIAIDVTATPIALTGAGYYVQELVSRLDTNKETELLIIARKSDKRRFSEIAPNSKILNVAPDNTVLRIAYQTFSMGKLVDSIDADLFHGPHYQLPLKMLTPSVVTVHDMTLVTHPRVHTRAKRNFFSRVIPRSINSSKTAITVSQHTADDIARCVNSETKVVVAPLGVNTERFNQNDGGSDKELLHSRGISSPYIAFLGLIEPRKCIPTLVKAFSLIAEKYPEHKLVIAGGNGWGINEVREEVQRSGFSTRIILPGRLSDDEVPALLRNAEIFVYPSMYEGFGMPVVEAMACGSPVITTKSSSLSEVAGNAALLINPHNEIELSQAIEELLRDEDARKKLIDAGIKRAKDFTWENCVELHLVAYREALGNSDG